MKQETDTLTDEEVALFEGCLSQILWIIISILVGVAFYLLEP